ncbi:MAG: HD domain-containing protein [bacterium]|nr:HD domain-containing protein [bacterium]
MEQDMKLNQLFDFFREIDKEKTIFRQTYLTDGSRKENDAEHAWHMAIMTILLSEYANEPIDVLKTVTMLLIHDIVEIDAGDTYAYDYEGQKTQHAREEKAANRIFGLLPEEQARKMLGLWVEFESEDTPEARFARTMDRIQPLILNDASGGISWKEHEVHIDQLLKRNDITPDGSKKLWDYAYENMLLPNVENGKIKK